ncbi:hypothetical protein VmeM32_00201 [Vibrio phage vB_VmeM-32]|nr:hypothetical protein VmeM32_00201 [Vibrio phage vB_VmeM-32]
MNTFTIGQVIKVNGNTFTVVKVKEDIPGNINLIGTLEGDPIFLAGKRTIYANQLVAKRGGYSYDWNAR